MLGKEILFGEVKVQKIDGKHCLKRPGKERRRQPRQTAPSFHDDHGYQPPYNNSYETPRNPHARREGYPLSSQGIQDMDQYKQPKISNWNDGYDDPSLRSLHYRNLPPSPLTSGAGNKSGFDHHDRPVSPDLSVCPDDSISCYGEGAREYRFASNHRARENSFRGTRSIGPSTIISESSTDSGRHSKVNSSHSKYSTANAPRIVEIRPPSSYSSRHDGNGSDTYYGNEETDSFFYYNENDVLRQVREWGDEYQKFDSASTRSSARSKKSAYSVRGSAADFEKSRSIISSGSSSSRSTRSSASWSSRASARSGNSSRTSGSLAYYRK